MAGRGEPGGILGLLDLIEEHRGAVEYDFRARFHLAAEMIGREIGWGEAVRLVRILRADPASMIAAAIEGWDYPLPRGDAVLMDLFDLEFAKTGARGRKPHPGRPWKQQGDVTKIGNAGGRSRAEVVEILNAHGHSLPV